MYVIKMNDSKELRQVHRVPLYQYENDVDTITFLLPRYYREHDLANCLVTIRYILPNQSGNIEQLELQNELYNGWLQYHYPIKNRFTSFKGCIEVWLTIANPYEKFTLKTDSTFIPIRQNKQVTEYLPDEDFDVFDKLTEDMVNLKNQMLDIKSVLVDNISFDEETGIIRLICQGDVVGDPIQINSMATGIYEHESTDEFPETGVVNRLYIDKASNSIYCWNDSIADYYLVGTNIYNLTAISGGDSSIEETGDENDTETSE